MPDNWSLPVAFYFKVEFQGEPQIGELAFKEVSGLNVEVETETFREGGVNGYEHKLPKGIKHPNLTLKRALQAGSGSGQALQEWQQSIFSFNFSSPIKRQDIIVKLLDADGNPLKTWTCRGAYPVKIETDSFESEKNQVAIETLEFCYRELA